MFQIVKTKQLTSIGTGFPVYWLSKDGNIDDEVYVERNEDESYKLVSRNTETSFRLTQYSINEFQENIELHFLWKTIDDFDFNVEIAIPSKELLQIKNIEEVFFNLTFDVYAPLAFWKYPYSFAEYKEEFLNVLGEENKLDINLQHSNNKYKEFSEIELYTHYKFSNESIAENIQPIINLLERSHLQTIELLESRKYENSVISSFEFPEQLKTFCEQYLLYFAQFLKDLGINATSNLKEEAGKVLFSVTPIDDVEALDKIREALAVYLHLPSSPIVYDESFAAMRQKQQIENLQHSQRMIEMEVRLSQKVIESQDKIIVQKDTLIDQQREIIEKIRSKSVMIDSAENKEELEELFEGVKVGKSKFLAEHLGLHLNPATTLKTVGKKILGRKDENKSVLGLDEKD